MAAVEIEELGPDSDLEWDHESPLYPLLPTFYGDHEKDEVCWDTFKFEVEMLLAGNEFSREVIKLGMIRALRGKAYDSVRVLGYDATIEQIISKLESDYGSVEPVELILRQFYGVTQMKGETIDTYSLRVEELFYQAVSRKGLENNQEILKNVLYEGLLADIKLKAAYKFDSVKNYDIFKKELRRIEFIIKEGQLKDSGHCLSAQEQTPDETNEMNDLVRQLLDRIATLENSQSTNKVYKGSQQRNGARHRWRHKNNFNHRHYRPKRPVYWKSYAPVCFFCNERGHIVRNCPKKISASIVKTDNSVEAKLVGNMNEAQIQINGVETRALLDSGSCVSLIAKAFYDKHLSNLDIQSLNYILNIECADGQSLPYIGYIEADLSAVRGLPKMDPQRCLFLISRDTELSQRTPVIIGTNILNEVLSSCKSQYGDRFLQTTDLHLPWYTAFRCITVRERELTKNKNRLAIVRSAVPETIFVRPNESINIKGYTDKEMDYHPCTAILHECEDSSLPSFIDITPGVVHYDHGQKKKEVQVNISNLTTNTITVSPRAILCELQPVTVDEEVFKKIEETNSPDVMRDIHIDDTGKLNQKQTKQIVDLLKKHINIFSKNDMDIGHCDLIKHRIDLLPEFQAPFKQPHRRIPPNMVEEVRQHLEQLLKAGIIKKSRSPWASNVVLVRKKNGKLRMCVDYRMLNNRSVKDAYALPRIEEVFDVLSGSRYFSTIDMKAGYHQVEVENSHKERTAFTVGPLGFYEYVQMPFGLSNSPATYQRLMEECLGDYNLKICVIYLDDLIIFADTFEQHLERIDLVLTRLKECNLKLSPEKCFFIQEKVNFLGHVVSEEGIETDPVKIEKVKNWPTPKNSDELRSFLAFAGYYRRFIKDFSKITRPLADLLPPTSMKKSKRKHKKPESEWKWTEQEQKTFEDLKDILSKPPILGYPDFTKPFELHTDASGKGLGAVLYQMQDDQKRVISYASRSLSKSEKNYPAHKLEFLALKWAVTEKFSDYLKMNNFIVYTDNNPLTYVLSSAKLDATGQRWVSALAQYNFSIKYRSGLNNTDADRLSRYPFERAEEEIKLENKTVQAICNCMVKTPLIETIPATSIDIVEVTEMPGVPMAQIEYREVRKRQREDNLIEKWRRAVIDKRIMDRKHCTNRHDFYMRKNFQSFKMIRGVLYREWKDTDKTYLQLVLPTCYRQDVLKGLHNDIGHPGRDRTLSLLRERYFWPGMASDVERWVTKCDRCIRRKSPTNVKSELVNIVTTYPLELVSMDFLTLEPSGRFGNILVITDHFTKYALAVPTRNQTAKTTAEAFYNNFIVHYGIPTKLHTDQGTNFESELIKELCLLMNIKKTRTTPYHPMGNGCTERWNRTLLNMLGTLETTQKSNWRSYIPSLVYAYNCTKHESTRLSPFELMFGRTPRLPIDSAFEMPPGEEKAMKKSTSEYVKELKERLRFTQDVAKKFADKARNKQKTEYDKKAKASKIGVGDKVLVRILAYGEGKHKIADKYEEEPYEVIEQPRQDIPVYRIRNESGQEKTIHRNHLLLLETDNTKYSTCDQVPDDDEPIEELENDNTQVESNEQPVEVDKNEKREKHGFRSDVTEEESDDECVWTTRCRGDAHGSESGNRRSSAVDKDAHPLAGIDENGAHSRPGIQIENQSHGNSEERVEVGTRVSDENNDQIGVTGQSRIEDGANTEIPLREEADDQHSGSDTQPLRRSARKRRPPDRYGEYVSYQVTERPIGVKLHTLDLLIKSGVLENLESTKVQEMINTVIK